MKILFVIPKLRFSFFGYEGIAPASIHLGIAYLISLLKQHNHEVQLFDEGWGKMEDDLFRLIEDFQPHLIGVTSFSPNRLFAYELIKNLKAKFNNIPVVFGGNHVSTVKGLVLKESVADFAIKHEGEYTLLDLIGYIDKGKSDFNDINGLIWRDRQKITENPDRPLINDLDKLPFPDFSLFKIEEHPSYKEKIMPMITSRSCPFGCTFCATKLSMGRGFRVRSAENVFEEIKFHYAQGYHQFDIHDDCFSLDIERANKILDLILNSKMQLRFQFATGIRVDTVSREFLAKLKKAGCFFIIYGAESGNERVLKDMRKGITLKQVREAVKWTNEVGIPHAVNFIVGHIGETYSEALDTIKFAKSLPKCLLNFGKMIPYPGTEVYEWASKNAHFLIDKDTCLDHFSFVNNDPFFETKEFTKGQRKKVIRMGFRLHQKRIFVFRFGPLVGNLIYLFIGTKITERLAGKFAMTRLGNRLARILAKKSYSRGS